MEEDATERVEMSCGTRRADSRLGGLAAWRLGVMKVGFSALTAVSPTKSKQLLFFSRVPGSGRAPAPDVDQFRPLNAVGFRIDVAGGFEEVMRRQRNA